MRQRRLAEVGELSTLGGSYGLDEDLLPSAGGHAHAAHRARVWGVARALGADAHVPALRRVRLLALHANNAHASVALARSANKKFAEKRRSDMQQIQRLHMENRAAKEQLEAEQAAAQAEINRLKKEVEMATTSQNLLNA